MSLPMMAYNTNEMAAAGNAMKEFVLNLSLILQPCVLVATMVVSEMNDRLSPKNAPPTTTATNIGMLLPVVVASPAAIGTRATMHPTLVPIDMLTKHVARNIPGRIIFSGSMDSIMFTVASMLPIVFADAANAPANMKTHIISIMPLVPAPLLNVSMRSLSVTPVHAATA